MITTLDSQVIEKFKEFQNQTAIYADLNIEEVEFERVDLSNENYFEFVKGKNHYIKKYNINNKGKYPLATGSVKNNSIAYYINPININDIVIQKCISFNKDGDSRVFYRDYDFLMDRHHIAIIPSELVLAKYLYFTLIPYFEKMKFGWGENVADVPTVSTHSIPIPKDLSRKYTSKTIQKAIIDFLEFWKINYTDIFRKTVAHQKPIIEKIRKALVLATLNQDKIMINSFSEFAKSQGLNLKLDEIEFGNSTLGDVINLIGGDRITKKNNSGTKYPVYGGGDVSFKTDTYNRENEYIIGRFAISETCVRFVNQKFHLLDSGFTFNVKNHLKSTLDKNFIGYFLLSTQHKIYACAKGSGQKNLDTKLFNKIEFSFPKDLETQILLVDFWKIVFNNIDERLKKFENITRLTDKIDKAFLYRTFSKINWRE